MVVKKQGRTWREMAAPVVSEVLKATKGKEEKEIRKALRDAYPFGERANWPYKAWLDEIKRQRKLVRKKSSRKSNPYQLTLF